MTSDFQSRSSRQGAAFDAQCSELLLPECGFTVKARRFVVPELGIEIDCEAVGPGGTTFWFEFKGSYLGSRPGARRTDTVKKALASCLLASVAPVDYPPFVLMTSHPPKLDSRGATMLVVALQARALAAFICAYEPGDLERLKRLEETLQWRA